jgi:hypothetical protein
MGLRSEIRDPGVKKASDPGSGSATLEYFKESKQGLKVCTSRNKQLFKVKNYTLRNAPDL